MLVLPQKDMGPPEKEKPSKNHLFGGNDSTFS